MDTINMTYQMPCCFAFVITSITTEPLLHFSMNVSFMLLQNDWSCESFIAKLTFNTLFGIAFMIVLLMGPQ